MITVRFRLWMVFSALLLSSFVGGCGSTEQTDATNDLTPVTLTLNWFPDAQHGGFYAAKLEGFFEDEGLDVTIRPGGPNVPVIQETALGRTQFAVANADQVLLGREKDANVIAVFAAMQTSPRCILVHKDSGIESLQDLNKLETLALGTGKSFSEFLTREVDLSSIKIVPYSGNISPFLSDPKYGQQGYVFSEPLVAERNGAAVNVLLVSKIGFDPYTSVVITGDSLANKDPELIARFARACAKGWAQYLEKPNKTNEHILTLNRQMDAETLSYAAAQIKPLCLIETGSDNGGTSLGTMSAARWELLREQLIQNKLLPENTGAAADAWTNQFLESER
jgi:NitT/TauT family transport system substrate-binding protein